MRAERIVPRLTALVCLVLALWIWNAVFDRGIGEGVKRYLHLQRTHAEEGGPFVHVKDVMRSAARESAVRATLWSAPLLLVGAVAAVRLRAWGRASALPGQP